MRQGKYIITIEDILNGQYPELVNVYPKKFFGKSCTNNYKIIFIEDIFGNSYESINNDDGITKLNFVDFMAADNHTIETLKINEIYLPKYALFYYFDKNNPFYLGFFDNKEWRLFENGFSQLCKFKSDIWTYEVFIDNGKVIGDFTLYFKDKLRLKVNFDKIDSGEIQFTYFIDGKVEKIENNNKEEMIEQYKTQYRGGIYDLIMS